MSDASKFNVEITASDSTDKGFDSAEKRAEKYGSAEEKRRKAAAKQDADQQRAAEKAAKERDERRAKTSAGAHARGFAAAEKAFGGGAVSDVVGGRLRGAIEAGKTVTSAFAAASHESAGLADKIGAVGVAAAGATGVVIGLALGAAKLAANWVQGAAALDRLSAGIGVSTDDLQRWQGAGERFGVDKETMGAALGGVGGTIHEAAYGRNNEALAALNQLGIGIKRTKDGSVDVDGMTASLSDAIARQKDPYTQARIANMFGIPQAALPALRQGSGVLRAQGEDFAKYGGMVSADDVGMARREYGKGVQLRQIGERGLQAVQSGAARVGEGALDGAIAAGRGAVDGVASAGPAAARFIGSVEHTFAPAVRLFDQGAHEISVSAERLVSFLEGRGLSHLAAVGLTASAYAESGLNAHRQQRGGPAYGLGQWEGARRRQFQALTGHDLSQANWQEQASFMAWETSHTERRAGRKLAMAKSFAEAGAAASLYYERPRDAQGQAAYRAGIADQIGSGTFVQRHKVDVEVHDHRTKAKVRSPGGAGAVAVGYAGVGTG